MVKFVVKLLVAATIIKIAINMPGRRLKVTTRFVYTRKV